VGSAIDLKFAPWPHQREAHERRLRFSVLVWHRRAGKTVWAIVELILAAIVCTRQAPRFAYIAPYYRQAKSVAWEYLRRFALCIPGTDINETELSVRLPNGAVIRLYGADNPDTLRGLYFDGVVLDEVADMRPQVWGEIIRPALADREGWAVFIGTPKGHNLFSEKYFEALQNPAEWFADLRRASDTGAIAPAELEKAKREMSPPQWAQEMECDFGAAVENALCPLEVVLAAQKRAVTAPEIEDMPVILGVDVARMGGDRSVIARRQGRALFPLATFRQIKTMELVGRVARALDEIKPDACFIDSGGIGAGVVDRLEQMGHDVIPVDFGETALDARFDNRRAEMWWGMADWLVGASIPPGADLVADLTAPTYDYANRRGRLALESKDSMRERGLASPDLADAIALTFAAPVACRKTHDALLGYELRRGHVRSELDDERGYR